MPTNLKKRTQDYYLDQIYYITDRKKKIEKGISDREKIGLPIDLLDQIKVAECDFSLKRYQTNLIYLYKADLTDNQVEDYIKFIINSVEE